MTFQEAKKVKTVEGIPPDGAEVLRDIEKGVELKQKPGKEEKKQRKQQDADEEAPRSFGDEKKPLKRTPSKLEKKRPVSGGKL